MERSFGKQSVIPDRKARTCFIAAPSKTNLEGIKKLLRQKGLRPIVASDLSEIGAPLLEHIKTAISRADLILSVLDPKQANEEVYFEIGFATALGKKILLLAPPEIWLLSDIMSLPCIRSEPENLEAISFALDQAIAVTKSARPKRRRIVEKTRAIGRLSQNLIERLENLGGQATHTEIQEIIGSALRASGVNVVAQSQSHDRGVDIAIWADELEPWVGNPFAIEIKKGLRSLNEMETVASQLSVYLKETDSRWALVLYFEGPPVLSVELPSDSRVLFMEVRRLLDRLRTESFVEIVRELRNERVHGKGH